jgi:hypothetical protein
MISIGARSTDVEPEINLRKRTNRNSHGRGIVSDLPRLMGRSLLPVGEMHADQRHGPPTATFARRDQDCEE